jgi:excisionase family DNA binding protein
MATEPEFLSIRHIAELLDVNPSTVWRWVRTGQLPAVRCGPRLHRVHRTDFDAFLVRWSTYRPAAPEPEAAA